MKSSRPVVRIAHAYGNTRKALDMALAADIDMIELDVWYRAGELYVRHEHRVRFLPILYDVRLPSHMVGPLAIGAGRYFFRPDIHRLTLREVLKRVDGKKRLLVDAKGVYHVPRLERFSTSLVETIRGPGAETWVEVCGQTYAPLHRIRELAPEIPVRYSIEKPYQWERFLRLMDADPPSQAICIQHRVIDEEKARLLEDRGIDVYCWTVDDLEEAQRLVNKGVDGIISNDLALLAGLPHGADPTS